MMGSALLSVPELRIDAKEAEVMAAASSEVLKHYAIVIDEKQAAWMNLTMACVGIYGTRAVTFANRLRNERNERRAKLTAPQTVPVAAGPVGVQSGVPPVGAPAAPAGGRANGVAGNPIEAALAAHMAAPAVDEL